MGRKVIIEFSEDMRADPRAWWELRPPKGTPEGRAGEVCTGRILGAAATEVNIGYDSTWSGAIASVTFRSPPGEGGRRRRFSVASTGWGSEAPTRISFKNTDRGMRVLKSTPPPEEIPRKITAEEIRANDAFVAAMESGDTKPYAALSKTISRFMKERMISPTEMAIAEKMVQFEKQGKFIVADRMDQVAEGLPMDLTEKKRQEIMEEAVYRAAQKLATQKVGDTLSEELEKLVREELDKAGYDPDRVWDTRGRRRLKR